MKNLIKILRPLVIIGTRTYWFIFRPTTSGAKIILTHQGEVLFVKHTYGYTYTFPGGGIKKNETPEQAVRREVNEELSVTLEAVTYLGSFLSTTEFKKDTVHVFCSELNRKDISLDNLEIDQAQWFSFDHIPKLGPIAGRIFNLYRPKIQNDK